MFALLFALVPYHEAAVHNHVDLIEVNHVYSGDEYDNAEHFVQIIFWEYDAEHGYRVFDWRMARRPDHYPHKSGKQW